MNDLIQLQSFFGNVGNSARARKVVLAVIITVLLFLQTWKWFYHQKEHIRSLQEMDWLHHPGLRHPALSQNKSSCPECSCVSVHGKRGKHMLVEKKCPVLECAPCPSGIDPGIYKYPVYSAREIRSEYKVDPTWPSSAKEAMIHIREKLEKEQQLRFKMHAELKDAVSQRDKFEERLKMVKRALYETQTTQDDYYGALSTEKHRCSEKIYQLMSTSLRNRLYANALKSGNVTVEMNLWLANLTMTPSPPPPGASRILVVTKETAAVMMNETVPEMMQRRLKDAVLDLKIKGWEVSESLIKELEDSPLLSNTTLDLDDIEVEDSMTKAREDWLNTMRGSRKYIFKNLEILIKDPVGRARLVARTPDSERIFPELFQNTTMQQSITQQSIPLNKTPRRKSRPSKSNTYSQLLMATPERTNSAPEYQRCAIVGNSQRLLLYKYGKEIDDHDVVMRLNNAPTIGFEPYVGSKTTHRLVNNQWTKTYSTGTRLPLEWNVTVLASRTDFSSYVRLFTQLKTNRGDIAVVRLTMEGANRGGALLRTIGSRLERWRGLDFVGKGSPSSGFIAVYLMMQMCASLNVYGVALEGCAGSCAGSTAWHYWQEEEFRTSREFGEDPHHSFELEHDVVRLLEAEKFLKLVTKSRKSALSEDKDFLSKKVPFLLKASQDIVMKAKLEADIQCAATTGYVCGCSRTCVSPTNAFVHQMDARLKLETERVKLIEKDIPISIGPERDLQTGLYRGAFGKPSPTESRMLLEGNAPGDISKENPAGGEESGKLSENDPPPTSSRPPVTNGELVKQHIENAAKQAKKKAEKMAAAAHLEMMRELEVREKERERRSVEAAARAAAEEREKHEGQESVQSDQDTSALTGAAIQDDPIAQTTAEPKQEASINEESLEDASDKEERKRLIKEQLLSMEKTTIGKVKSKKATSSMSDFVVDE